MEKQKHSFCMWLKFYQLNADCFKIFHISPMVTTMKIPMENMQKNEKEMKAYHFIKTREHKGRQWESKEKGLKATQKNNEQDGNSKSYPINNYFKCKWVKFPKRHKEAECIFFLNNQDPTTCCLQETQFRFKVTHRQKVKGWKKIFHVNSNQKSRGNGTYLVLDETNFKSKTVTRDNDKRVNPPKGCNNYKYICTQHQSI